MNKINSEVHEAKMLMGLEVHQDGIKQLHCLWYLV